MTERITWQDLVETFGSWQFTDRGAARLKAALLAYFRQPAFVDLVASEHAERMFAFAWLWGRGGTLGGVLEWVATLTEIATGQPPAALEDFDPLPLWEVELHLTHGQARLRVWAADAPGAISRAKASLMMGPGDDGQRADWWDWDWADARATRLAGQEGA